jgi:methionine-rich copper-binding protein CopC
MAPVQSSTLRRAAVSVVIALSMSPAPSALADVTFSRTNLAASHYLKLAPATVQRGGVLRVYGSVAAGCAASDRVTIYSRAFKGTARHEFAGVPAVYARQHAGQKFSIRVTIKATTRKGRYSVGGRCGGGNFGSATVTVT